RQYDRGGAHLENPCVFFLTGSAQRWLDQINGQANQIRRQQQADGSFLYNGKYLRGHWDNKASGHCGNFVVILYDHYRHTGNEASLAAALKGTDFLNTFRTPRGAQTWELSLHTPDIMGSAWCCIANVRAFEATGKDEYLKQARRWAVSGLPFVYQWETPLAGKEHPVMLYATTPVLGATNWVAPDWIGLPVQWCGLDYAEALFLLAEHDQTLDWKTIAEGILIAGEQMQYEKGASIGLLPDSWTMKTQKPNPADINPVVLERLRRRANGELAALDVQISPDGKTRVAAPLPIRFDGNTPIVDAPEGAEVQILVNGKIPTR
ncbi:MAG: glycoside hydrolase family 127 protein, partial [Planctomycetaceae bacterium]|nr:glycoside hydrolase family 127 protein [Planctomycetaceae bacterium]